MLQDRPGLRAVSVWPRRNGKDLTAINILAGKALKRKGLYLYIAPFANQVRSIIWEGSDGTGSRFIDYIPREIITRKLDQSMKLWLSNGSVIHLLGSDNPDAIVGTNPLGIVFTEFSLHKEAIWGYMRPILAENGGWALFNGCLAAGTPVITPTGLRRIEDMRAGQFVNAETDTLARVDAPHVNGIAEVYTVTTAKGYTLTATPNHKIDTPAGWVRIDALKPGQPLLLRPPTSPEVSLDLEAYVQGVIAGDGTISCQPGCHRVTVTLVKESKIQAILPRLREYTSDPERQAQWIQSGRGAKPAFSWTCTDGKHWRFSSKAWAQQLTALQIKDFPDTIFFGDKNRLASYIAGLFDTDGTVRQNTNECKFATNNFQVAKRVHQALFSLGIISTLQAHEPRNDSRLGWQSDKDSYTVTITGPDCILFFAAIPVARLKNTYTAKRQSPERVLIDTVATVKAESEPCETYDICLPAPHRYQAAGFTVHNTPRGMNHFYQMAKMAEANPSWFYERLTADDTGYPSKADIEEERQAGMPESLIEQEFYTSWVSSSEETLIPLDKIQLTVENWLEPAAYSFAPRIIGVDPAYAEKGDRAVIVRRQGRKVWEPEAFQGIDPMALATRVVSHIREWKAHYVFVDAGRGEAVWSRLNQLGYADRVIPVNFSGKTYDPLCFRKKDEIWNRLKQYICSPLTPDLPDHSDLIRDISAPTFKINDRGLLEIESKQHLKDRGFRSTDFGDALALTFSEELDETDPVPQALADMGMTQNDVGRIVDAAYSLDSGRVPYDPLNYMERLSHGFS